MKRCLTHVAVQAAVTTAIGCSLLLVVAVQYAQAAEVDFDGGITLVISYDDPEDWNGESFGDLIVPVDETENSGLATCTPTNEARFTWDAGVSPGSCDGVVDCTGQQKLQGDLKQLACYIFQSTHGAHYLKEVYLVDRGHLWGEADVNWSMRPGPSFGRATTISPGKWKSF